MPTVDYVVSSWNNRDRIAATLESILRQKNARGRTCYLVDGMSKDGTPEYVRSQFPDFKVVVKDSDSGPAGSRSIGAGLGHGEYIVFADSDCVLEDDYTEQQLRFFENHPRAGILCGPLLYGPNPAMLHTAYGVMNRYCVGWDGAIGQRADSFTEPLQCLWTNGTAFVVRREVIDRMGAFDIDLFAAHEDSDFGWRANLFGFDVLSNPAARATHKIHGTRDPAMLNDSLKYLVWRNRIRSSLVNYEWQNILRYMVPYLFLSLGSALVRKPRGLKFRAFWWNIVNLRGTLKRRRFVQKNRTVCDRELWHLFAPGISGPGYDAVEKADRTFRAHLSEAVSGD